MKTCTLFWTKTIFCLLCAVAWSTAWGQSTTKPSLSNTELCLPETLTVTFDYSGGTPNTSTTVIVQLRDNSASPNTTLLEQSVPITTDGSGNKTGVQATLDLTTATANIVGTNRRIRIRNAANTNTISNNTSDGIKISVTPTFTGASQASAVCSGTNATINLTGLLPNTEHTVRYKIGSGSKESDKDVTSDGSGKASFPVPVTSDDNGQTLTIIRLTNTTGHGCPYRPLSDNTVTLQVNPLPTATLSFSEGDGTVCSTEPLPLIRYNLTGTSPWTISFNNNPTSVTYSGQSAFRAPGAGPYQLTSISDANGCVGVASNTLTVTVNQAATATALTLEASAICQGGTVSVSASFGGSATSGTFDDGGACGTFTTPTTTGSTVSVTYTPDPNFTGPVTITFATNDPDGPCPAATSSANLTVNPAATATAPTLEASTICQGGTVSVSASFGGSATSGSFSDGGAGGSFGNVTTTGSTVSATYAPAANFTGPVTITFTTNDPDGDGPCPAATSSANLTVNPAATATAPTLGASAICQGSTVSVSASFGGSATSGSFSDGGAGGSFGNVTTTGSTVSATYAPAANFTGPVTITFTTNDPDGPCPAATSSANLTVGIVGTVVGLPTTPNKVCQGEPLPVTFAVTGTCTVATPYTVQLSNATGSFVNPTNLGTAAPGTASLTLPAGLPLGTGYRVRVVIGGVPSPASLPFRVEGPSLGSLTPTVSGVPAGGVCRGQDVTVSFNLPGGGCPFPQGNAFAAQLSSATGSFNNPTTLGPVTPGSPSPVTIPATTVAGTGYRIRVVSSNPTTASTASAPFQVKACNARLSAEEAALVVAPNPARGGEIRCRVRGMDTPAFSLTTAAGRGVGVSVKTDGSGEFVLTPRQALSPGVYVLQAREGQTQLTRRVLVSE